MANWTLVIEKAWVAPGGEDWNNTSEIGGSGALSIGTIMPIVNDIITMERNIHLADVFFVRARVGAYAPSVDGYDPFRFFNIAIGLPGLRQRGSIQPVDLEQVWKLNRIPSTGNAGFMNYRGVLTEIEVSSVATGKPRLEYPDTMPGGAMVEYVKSKLSPYLGTAPTIFLAMIGEYKIGGSDTAPIYGPTVLRRVSQISVFGAGRLKLNKKAYQRPGPDIGDGIVGGGSGGPFVTSYVDISEEAEDAGKYEFTFGGSDPETDPLQFPA